MTTIDIKTMRDAWERFDAGCSGLIAQKCKHHRPYMGCPLDCGDVENAIGEEWRVFQPLIGPLIDEVETLRALLEEACGELNDTGGEVASRRAAELRALATKESPAP